MSCESSDQLAPPELTFPVPNESDFGKDHLKWSKDEIQTQIPTDILLITANDNEFAACYAQMENVQRSWHKTLGMVDFGRFIGNQDVKVTLMKCTAQGPIAAAVVVTKAAEILYPKVVLFVGICATMNSKKAKLGDVVISAKLASYEDRKIREDGTVEYRGPKANISPKMGQLILHAAGGWQPPLKDPSFKVNVHHRDAVMLSGPELVNNPERRQELAEYFRDALGLEMEGAGLYAAAFDLRIEWAVIKGVSDFADGSKSATKDWQPFSSAMAASLVRNMFKHADIIQEWPYYKNIDPKMGVDDAKKPRQKERSDEDEIDAKRPRQKEKSDEDEIDAKRPRLEKKSMCVTCDAMNEDQLPNDRNKWPIYKIDPISFQQICKKLDLATRNEMQLLDALGCFDRDDADTMITQFESKGGQGLAKLALGRWGSAGGKNNVEAFKAIVAKKVVRDDVLGVIKKWENLPVCHGCGKRLDNN